jgi:hypothetical protein
LTSVFSKLFIRRGEQRTLRLQKTSKDFTRLQYIGLQIFKRLQRSSKNFSRLRKTSRNFKQL